MKNVGDLMQRLQKMMPAHSKRVKSYWPGRKNKGRSDPPLSNVKIGR